MRPDRSAVDHLDVAVVCDRYGIHQQVPHTCFPPSHETVVAGGARAVSLRQVTPRCTRPKHPEDAVHTRRSSTRATPRGLLDRSGAMTRHSKSVKSYRLMPILSQHTSRYEHHRSPFGRSSRSIGRIKLFCRHVHSYKTFLPPGGSERLRVDIEPFGEVSKSWLIAQTTNGFRRIGFSRVDANM